MHGTEYWKQFWQQPRFGIRVEYLRSTNGIAGDRIAIAGELRNTVWRSDASGYRATSHEIFWYTGAGLALFTKPYERTHDTLNQFIGSYLNCIFNLGASYTVGFPDRSALTFGLRFSHSSNGYMLKPNQGLNYLLGTVDYRLSNANHERASTAKPTATDTSQFIGNKAFARQKTDFSAHRIWVSFAPSMVQSRWFGNPNITIQPKHEYYFAYTAQAGYMYYINPCIGFGANIDVMYNYSHVEMMNVLYKKDGSNPYIGAAANFEPRWGCMSIRLSAGYYLLKSEIIEIPLYERLGVFFHFGNRFNQFAGVTIKAHAAHADYIEWHYGIELFIRKPNSHRPS